MSKYVLDTRNSLKNKIVEDIYNASTIKDLLKKTDVNELTLKSIIGETTGHIADNITFYNCNLNELDTEAIISTLNLTEGEENKLNDIYETGDVKDFINFYEEKFFESIKKDNTKTYDLVGNYVKTINSLSTKHFINIEYMNTMVSTINGMKDNKNLEIDSVLKNLIVDIAKENDETADIEVLKVLKIAHSELADKMKNVNNNTNGINEALILFVEKVERESLRNNKLKKYVSAFKEEIINSGYSLKEIDMEGSHKFNDQINYFKDLLSKSKGITKSKLNEVKEFMSLLFLEENDLLSFLSNNDNLKSIRENSILKKFDIDTLLLSDQQKSKLKMINDISNFSLSVYELTGTEININVSELFYNKFGMMVDDNKSKEYTKELFAKYLELKETTKNKNNNILLYITLHSFDEKTKEYNSDLEQKYVKLLTKASTTYTKDEIELLNKIEDKWLKWAICHNREFKDNTITFTNINPLTFNFSEFQLAKKELERNLTPKEIELVQVSSLIPNLNYKKMLDYAPQNVIEEKILENFVANEQFNIRLDKISSDISHNELYNLLNIYNSLNKNKELLEKTKEKGLDITNLLVSEKESIQNVLSKLSSFNDKEVRAIGVMLENTKVVPGNLNRRGLVDYIKYYAEKMDSIPYKLYKKDNSLIPTINYDINKNYSIKSLTIKEFASILNGEVCNHCMSYGGASWNMIEYMFKKPESFLITQLEKDGVGMANSATWVVNNQICFDSIELVSSGGGMRESILNAYREHSLKLLSLKPNIDRILFGYSNHNNNFNFNSLGLKTDSFSLHPSITLPVNVYSDAKVGQQYAIYSFNELDIISPLFNDFQIKSLKEYTEYKDIDHKSIKYFLENFNKNISIVCDNINTDCLNKMENKEMLVELFNNYGIKNEVLKNEGTSKKYEELKVKLENVQRDL